MPTVAAENAASYVDLFDGLLLLGGFDVDPTFYGQEPHFELGETFRKRDLFEIALLKATIEAGKPIMGICLGMQLLFDKSYEYGEHQGLGLIPGVMADLKEDIPANLKVPHMGWNSLHLTEKGKKHPLFKYSKEGDYVYFVHSFYGKDCDESLLATSEYGIPVTASAANENVMGCQFHPEKSSDAGARLLANFATIARAARAGSAPADKVAESPAASKE